MNRVYEPINFCDGVYYSPDGVKRKADGLSVRLTSFCANSCDFCIASESMKTHLRKNIPQVIKNTLESGTKGVQILGGEPLLFLDDCLEFVHGIREHVNVILLTTSLPITVARQYEKFCQLMEKLDFLTVSLQSTNSLENDKIMHNKKPHDVMKILEKVNNDFPDKVMVVLNLSQGGLDSRLKVMNALDDLNDISISRVRINELQQAGKSYVNFEEMFPELQLKSPFAHGCKTYLKNFYPGMQVIVKRSCFLVEESLGATIEDEEKVRYRHAHPEKFAWQESNVIYEDGSLKEYWTDFRKEC